MTRLGHRVECSPLWCPRCRLRVANSTLLTYVTENVTHRTTVYARPISRFRMEAKGRTTLEAIDFPLLAPGRHLHSGANASIKLQPRQFLAYDQILPVVPPIDWSTFVSVCKVSARISCARVPPHFTQSDDFRPLARVHGHSRRLTLVFRSMDTLSISTSSSRSLMPSGCCVFSPVLFSMLPGRARTVPPARTSA